MYFGATSTILLMPQGSNFLLLRQKTSHQRKGDPDDCPDPAMLRKKRNGPKLASLKHRAVLIAFFLRFSRTIHGARRIRRLFASQLPIDQMRGVSLVPSQWLCFLFPSTFHFVLYQSYQSRKLCGLFSSELVQFCVKVV
jgi:hypothetical protein